MSIVLKCGKCQGRFKAPESLAGKRIRCKCGTVLAVPVPRPAPATVEIADLSGIIDDIASGAGSCPGCAAPLDASAIICTACGFNRKTGQRMSVKVEEEAPSKGKRKEKAEKAAKPVKIVGKESSGRGGAAVGLIIKIVLIVAVLGGLGYGGYMVKEAVTLDPHKQSQDALKKITNGMTIAQVVKTLEGPPKEVWAMQDPPKGSPGFPQDKRIGYADNFLKHHGKEKLKYGFRFVYLYSERDQLHIHFTPQGKVTQSELVDPMKALGM